ncbi:t-SNARE affecting a late Golgi compartment protein 2, partial [Elasticomyces elasticus]
MWRDRTSLFLSYRSTYTHPNKRRRYGNEPSTLGRSTAFSADASEETQGLMSGGDNDGDAIIEMDLLPPRWLDIQEEVNEHIKDIQLKIPKLDKLHSKHILPGFDDEDVKAREEIEIENLTQEITRSFQECRKCIKRIERMVKESQRAGTLNRGEEVMAGNVQVALAS